MYRFALEELKNWASRPDHKPLVLRGARQVGKSYLATTLADEVFDAIAEINFEQTPEMAELFSSRQPERIIPLLELRLNSPIIPGKTLLFLDEIQAAPEVFATLRYFYEQMPELHVVAAGSLLEFAFGDIAIPVGRVQYLHMHPMTFYEYLLAMGKEPMAEYTLTPPENVADPIQQMILSELRGYFFVGGMPECIKTYRDSGSMVETFRVQSEILDSYRDDFSKYRPRIDTMCLDAVFLNVARNAGEQLKYVRLDQGHSGLTNRKALDLLVKAKVIHKIPSCDPSGLPLGATANQKKFKAAMLDIGLLQRLCQVPAELELQQENLLAMYRGKLAEQFVAQELLAWHSSELFYWAREVRGSNAEVDYLVVREGKIYPIEVKSGSGGSLRSLQLMLEKYPNCPNGLVLYSGTYKKLPEQKLVFMPLYCVATIGDKRPLVV